MKRLFRSATLIVAAMVGSGVILVAFFSLTQGLGIYGSSPADVLPAKGTVLLLHRPTPKMRALFPKETAGLPSEAAAMAFLETSKDLRGAVAFLEEGAKTDHRIGRYGLEVTNPLLLPSISSTQEVLADDSGYRRLRAAIPATVARAATWPASSSWIFAGRGVISQKRTLFERFLSALCTGSAATVAFVPGEKTVQCSFGEELRNQKQALRDIANLRGAFLTLSFADLRESWNRMQKSLANHDAMVLEGLLRTGLRRFGTKLSLEHDVWPLLSEPGTIHLVASGATVDIVVEGNVSDTDELLRIVGTLHDSYASTLPSSRITRRTLDKRFSSFDVRSDDTQIEKNRDAYKGWAVQATRENDAETGLLTAVRGKRFILATTEDLLRAALDLRTELPLPESFERSLLLAGGFMDLPRVGQLFRNLLSQEGITMERMGTGTLLFSSSQKDGVHSLVILSKQKFPELLDSLP